MSEFDRRQSDREGWHLDKRVPISLIVAIVLQTISIVWWAAKSESKLDDHERRLTADETASRQSNSKYNEMSERLARIEEKINGMIDELRRQRGR